MREENKSRGNCKALYLTSIYKKLKHIYLKVSGTKTNISLRLSINKTHFSVSFIVPHDTLFGCLVSTDHIAQYRLTYRNNYSIDIFYK